MNGRFAVALGFLVLAAGCAAKFETGACGAEKSVSSAMCRDSCRSDSDFQKLLKNLPMGGNTNKDMAPNCAAGDGNCICEATLLPEVHCHQCADGGVEIFVEMRKFFAIEAVTAFPAKLDDQGAVVGRVCGAPLDPNDPELPAEPGVEEANGLEVTANFMSSNLSAPACGDDDRDLSIKSGEPVELEPLRVPTTVAPGNFQFTARCVGAATAECGSAEAQILPAASVTYKNIADRCDPGNAEATRINVALLIDNSGSMKGNVDRETLREDADGYYDPSPPPLPNVASDWYGYRVNSAEAFIDSLNTQDRVISYLFDGNGPRIASSDSFICTDSNTGADNGPCRPEDATTCPPPGHCDVDPLETNDSYAISLDQAQCLAFGSDVRTRSDLVNGLALKRNSASGRAPLWQTVDTAFTFLSSGGQTCPLSGLKALHMVVLADGPDTCSDGDDFSYQSLRNNDTSGKCRAPCPTSTVKWHELLIKMAKAGYPVHVHFIQFQAPGYKDPDPRMLEMACRTDGTYQFINSESFDKSASADFANALTRAVNRVRDGLSGTWRVGFKWPAGTQLAKGALMAVDGDFVFKNTAFSSLAPASTDMSPDSWRFRVNGAEDRRALVRLACTSDADCGATDNCAANHCGEGGLCRGIAPDGRSCKAGNSDGRCHKGTCMAGETCAVAIAP